ncbi:hypothetical protein G3O08_02425 [Cryomorpha ignava]|uniref:Uncharacterized protein n=1 Tax=Cryomorpha ignava TaxID=101383 RepID=A0A7K3WL30_9FLAO|nr:hypothetical protein [Cryomorpha ignava]NEN22356.1 hypothetical protein [Cryomorpha ignava]
MENRKPRYQNRRKNEEYSGFQDLFLVAKTGTGTQAKASNSLCFIAATLN